MKRIRIPILSLLISALAGTAHAAPARPNIILVMPDDVGCGDYACLGHPVLRPPAVDAYRPEHRGFDEVSIHGGGGIGQIYPGSCGDAPGHTNIDPTLWHNGKFEKTTGYCTDLFFAQALEWIDARRTAKQPFFAYIPLNAAHGPPVLPEAVARLRATYDQWWTDVQPMLVNENVTGPKINPFQALYYRQFGGSPTPQALQRVDPTKADGVEGPAAPQRQRNKQTHP